MTESDQIALVRTLLPIAWRHGACVSLHGEAALAKAAKADGVHLSARSDPIVARELLGADKLIGVSIHTITEAQAIDPCIIDYAIAGPAFETASKPGYGPEIGREGLVEIADAARVPILAIGGINVTRASEVLALGPAGIAVMGGVMRAADPQEERKRYSRQSPAHGTDCVQQKRNSLYVHFGTGADILGKTDVRFTPNSGHGSARS